MSLFRLHLQAYPHQSWGYRLNVMFVWLRHSLLHVGSGTPIVKSIAVGCLHCFMQDWVTAYCHYAQCFPARTNTPHVCHHMCLVHQSPHLQSLLFYTSQPCRDVSIASVCVLIHSEQLERGKLVPWAIWFGIREIRFGGRTDPLRWGVIHCGRYLHGDDAHHLSLMGDG